MTNLLKFIFLSSANPAAISSTLKSASVMVVPLLMWYYGLDEQMAGEIFSDFLTIVSLLMTVIFLARKIILTIAGRNVNL
jgi:hypothetical protein